MNIKSPQTLISEASQEIKTISAEEALNLSKKKGWIIKIHPIKFYSSLVYKKPCSVALAI